MKFYVSNHSMDELVQNYQTKIHNLEKKIGELEEQIKLMSNQISNQMSNQLPTQQIFEPEETDSLSDVLTFQVGDALITEKTGFISVEKNIELDGEQLHITKNLPYSIIKVQTPLNPGEKGQSKPSAQ